MDINKLLVDVTLLQADWLWLIIPLIIFLIVQPLLIKKQWLKLNQTVNTVVVKHPYAQIDTALHLKITRSQNSFITLLSGCLILLALAQPVQLGERIKIPDTSADIMLIIDTSISMVIRDYQLNGNRVNRMSMTQALLDRFSRRFSGQRIGMVIFGDPPQILLEPSQDKNLVRHLIHRLEPTIAGRMAALGDAVSIAADYIQSKNFPNETVLVLISDAVSPMGKLSPIEGAKRVAKAKIILHTIAVGSANTEKNSLSASQIGELLYEPADTKLMQQMADITGGESFHGVDVESIDKALSQIEKRHQIKANYKLSSRKQQPLYYWPLLLALFLLGLKEVISVRYIKSLVA